MGAPTRTTECVLLGEESLLVECGRELVDRGFSIVAVVSENEHITDWSTSIGAQAIRPERDLAAQLHGVTYDWLFSIANLRMLPESVWKRARLGAVNFHDGPLPRYAGLNTPAWAILADEEQHGVTWHALADGADTGDIYVQRLIDISTDETTLTLNTKCFEAGIDSFAELVTMIESGRLEGQMQDFATRSYFARDARPAGGATLDFTESSADIVRLARALDFGPSYANPLCAPKLRTSHCAYNVSSISVVEDANGVPGTVLAVAQDSCDVATADGAVRIAGLSDATGQRVQPSTVVRQGDVLAVGEDLDDVTACLKKIAPHEPFFGKELASLRDLELYGVQPTEPDTVARLRTLDLAVVRGDGPIGEEGVAAVLAALLRVTNADRFGIALVDDALVRLGRELPGYVGHMLPLNVASGVDQSLADFIAAQVEKITKLRAKHAYPGDLVARTPALSMPSPSVGIRLTSEPDQATIIAGTALTFIVPETAGDLRVIVDQSRVEDHDADVLANSILTAAGAVGQGVHELLGDLPVMSPQQLDDQLNGRNRTARDYDRAALVHQLIEAQVARTPEAAAVACGDRTLTYAELDAQANAVARALIGEGAGPDTLIGIYMQRSVDLVIGVLGILKAGAAYVPLDPTYPADRVALMIEDSGLQAILTQQTIAGSIPSSGPRTVMIEDAVNGDRSALPAAAGTKPDHLAYVIYTSGSTGRPKGVMVEHRNLVNFFVAMDDRIAVPEHKQPVWLAVTSLSFDISVLELVWTLTRGFKVVVHVDDKVTAAASSPVARKSARIEGGMDFSLFYWGHDDKASPNKYHLLLNGSRFADDNGFCAIWTPERHFHAFGGAYPNPSVTGAAVAGCTRNLEIRAGSCVLPLHHPARVAEEWSVIDNISNGRTGLAFAAGWMPEDFLLRPENAPPNNKKGAAARHRHRAAAVARREGCLRGAGRQDARRRHPAATGAA